VLLSDFVVVFECATEDYRLLLEMVHRLSVRFKSVLADAQYSSMNVRDATEWLGAEPIIPVRRTPQVEVVLRVECDFVAKGVPRLVRCIKRFVV